MTDRATRCVRLLDREGLHVRPASLVVKEAKRFSSDVVLVHGATRASAKALLEVMMLAVPPGGDVTVEATGDDAEAAAEAVAAVLSSIAKDARSRGGAG